LLIDFFLGSRHFMAAGVRQRDHRQLPTTASHEMEKIAFNLPEACQALGLGRTTLYAAIKIGELKAVKAGRRTLITREALQDFLDQRPSLPTLQRKSGRPLR
jgi:excisionase family DNA binding protein